MSPEDLKALRKELSCTARDLADALGVEQKTVLAWEQGEIFATKHHVDQLEDLRRRGPSAIAKKPRGKAKSGLDLVDDARLWTIVKKLLTEPAFFAEVEKLARNYGDADR